MKINNIRAAIGMLLLVTFLSMPFIKPIHQYLSIPNQITLFQDTNEALSVPALGNNVDTALAQQNNVLEAMNFSQFKTVSSGESSIVYELAGLPIKKVNVDVLSEYKVVPGGQSIGVNLQTLGVLVVGHHKVNVDDGQKSPGEEADIQVGDIILRVNNKEIEKMEQITKLVNEAGRNDKPLDVTIKRGEKTLKKELIPTHDEKEDKYQIGLYIRDSAAGIGTMTFYDPKTKKYGALGHVISDMDTRKPIQIHDGTIVKSNITSIQKGNNGTPGEKQATLENDDVPLGTITKNSPFGVFGSLDKDLESTKWNEPMPIALSSQVKEGPAQILTVVEDQKVEAFDVEIVNSVVQKNPATKGMIVKIIDDKLLDKTGGIVQGMSGSPIIQEGKLIGAVTHVFVNDPTSGYGIHIEWMLNEAGIDIYEEKEEKQAS
ncbi:SpoIVB peptidase [Paraliobacillus quinghaiensis]|uniref:SpoIVB peptidase n=1 Tax=Paraliobacillus quinghaiensis TaxID=470815 RepID=A0A917TVS3_9BACI|nr:SpoIVB peptidase [Paraliobacillus quinghaiensis]GGM40322.1 SpoIVB peptidase [Paraliobacillus quinghaiensis]